MKDIVYDCRWSSNLDDKFINSFISVHNSVLGHMSLESFYRKYINNIYGDSVLVVAYKDQNPVAADALWRNDIIDIKSYQSADTCVLPECRGMGIFKNLVYKKINLIKQEESFIYGFPNKNSFPGFINMGWYHIEQLYTSVVFNRLTFFKCRQFDFIDEGYIQWWFSGKANFYYYKHKERFFILVKRHNIGIYSVLGECADSIRFILKEVKFPLMLVYKSNNKKWYNSKKSIPMNIISYKRGDKNVPIWKIDAI